MGDHARAADFYRKTIEFISHPDRIDDYDGLDDYRTELESTSGSLAYAEPLRVHPAATQRAR